MTAFLDRRDARLLPSRHRFALFRLAAYVRIRRARTAIEPARLYFVDRDQSSFEQYSVAIWATLTTAALFAGYLETVWPRWAAMAAAIPLAALALQTPIVFLGSTALPLWERLTGRPIRRIRFHSRFMMSLIAAGALAATQSTRWPRYVGWHFFALVAANATAAALLWIVRGHVQRVERQHGVA